MQIKIKNQIVHVLGSVQLLQKKLLEKLKDEERISVLESCQQAAISVGDIIEKDTIEDKSIIPMLEEYCEILYILSQKLEITSQDVNSLDNRIVIITNKIKSLYSVFRVVFFPYKAEMWDSLESIWRACSADPRCECDVVPIPYFQFNAEEKKWEFRYDGDRFPADVPVVSYKYYCLEEMKPELAYIHNPYDDCNYVTSVHPDYYSKELKKNVDRLVYVPYYVTPGWISNEHMMLPAYFHMDYMVVQSEYAKECCKNMFYYNRILPLGSPKLDRVIQKSHEEIPITNEWKSVMQDKKILMLNTSITDLLNYGELLLNKIEQVFEIIKRQKNVVLLWRPHPLLEATIKSMRPRLQEQYAQTVERFLSAGIGVLDRTADVTNSVALSDAYMDAGCSSVLNLFCAAGKPGFILNMTMQKMPTFEEKRRIHFTSMFLWKDDVWLNAGWLNGIFCMNLKTRQLQLAVRVDKEAKWGCIYSALTGTSDGLYFSPRFAKHPVFYNFDTKRINSLCGDELQDYYFGKNIICNDSVFYMPDNEYLLLEWDMADGKWNLHTDCMSALWADCNRAGYMKVAYDCTVYDGCLWITTGFTNRILQYFPQDGEYKIHVLGEKEKRYSGIAADGNALWLSETGSGVLIKWIPREGIWENYEMPNKIKTWSNHNGYYMVHSNLIDMGRFLVTAPGHANGMICLDKETKEITLLAQEFWEETENCANGYLPGWMPSCDCVGKLDEQHILAQRACDGKMVVIDVESGDWETFYPEISEEDFHRLIDGEDGFEKADKRVQFCRKESPFFSMEGFVEDLADNKLDGVKERQIKVLSSFAANLDGTCGEKVHAYMMNVLDSQYQQEK